MFDEYAGERLQDCLEKKLSKFQRSSGYRVKYSPTAIEIVSGSFIFLSLFRIQVIINSLNYRFRFDKDVDRGIVIKQNVKNITISIKSVIEITFTIA